MDDVDAKCYFLDRCNISKCRSILYVELIKKGELETGNNREVFDVVNNERYENGNNEICPDEYFNINMEKPMVYDITFAQGHEGDILNESMSMENILHQDTISIASAPTPNRQTSRLDLDVAFDHCEPLAIDDTCKAFSFVDGLDIETGQEYTNKMEVKYMIINTSLKSCFDFNIVKSTTKLFVVKCKVEDCKWALHARSISGSDHFSMRTYTNIHTCSSSSVDKGNPKGTSQLVALAEKELNSTTGEHYITGENGNFLVDLEKRTCTCKVYDIDQIPCVHALAAFSGGQNNLHNLCSTYYLKQIWTLSYVQTIYPVPSESE